jgi:hypothetical protein
MTFNPPEPWKLSACPLWHVPIPVLKQMMGAHPSSVYGFGEEIAEIREMEPGDGPEWYSAILSARMKKRMAVYHTREEEVGVQCVLDASPSIDFGAPSKRMIAVKVMATLAHLMYEEPNQGTMAFIGAGEKIACMGDAGDQVIASGYLRRLLDHLLPAPPDGHEMFIRALKNHALATPEQLVCIFSDFLIAENDESTWNTLGGLCRRIRTQGSEFIFFRILDALECGFPSCAVTIAGENQSVWSGMGTNRALRRKQREIRTRLENMIGDSHVGFLEVIWNDDEEAIAEQLRDFLRARGRYIRTRFDLLL